MKKYLFLALLIILAAGSLFCELEEVLISISAENDAMKINEAEILHISSISIIAKVEQSSLAGISRDYAELQILDRNAEDAVYYLISHPNNQIVDTAADWGEVVYSESSLKIIRNESLPRNDILQSGYNLIQLKAKKISQGKIVMPQMLRESRDFIDDAISELEQDSVAYIIQSLQDFETRYAFAENRDEVTAWIQNRYFELGFEQAVQDSFFWNNVWHKNVYAVLPGTISPDEYIVIGGHHDSINNSGDPMISAPGADDNGSACAAVMEIARVLKEINYEPETTILFTTFAAEEVGLVGSSVMAYGMSQMGLDVRVMINNDMIANNSQIPGNWVLDIPQYTGYEYLTEIGISLMEQYTSLNYGNSTTNSAGSDSYSFWEVGYPVTYYFEDEFSPYYHSSQDVIDNCDLAYCTEVVKMNMAMLLSMDAMPGSVKNFEVFDVGDGASLQLSWSASPELDLDHYEYGIGTEPGVHTDYYSTNDTINIISGLIEGQEYYIAVAAVDVDGNYGFGIENSAVPRSLPQAPQNVYAMPEMNAVRMLWSPNLELDIDGYNIYRSETETGAQTILNTELIIDNYFLDDDVLSGQYYYYSVTAIDTENNESDQSEIICSRSVTLDSGILLVDNTSSGNGTFGNPTEEDCDNFYDSVLADFDYDVLDLEEASDLTSEELGIYSTVILHMNSSAASCNILERTNEISQYLDFGGQLLVSAFKPSQVFSENNSYPVAYEEGSFLYDYLKVSEINYNNMGRFYFADATGSNLENVYVDTLKTLPGLNYHMFNIESIAATVDSDELFSYGSLYDDNDPFGVMNGEPVVVGYSGEDFKTALFSFPFYYMDQSEVQVLLNDLLTDYFGEDFAGSNQNQVIPLSVKLQQNFPNPFNPSTTISFSLPNDTNFKTELTIYNLKGQKVKQLVNEKLSSGKHQYEWNGKDDNEKKVSSGLYFYQLTSGDYSVSRKMLLLK